MALNRSYVLIELNSNASIYNTNYGIDDYVSGLCFSNVFNLWIYGIGIPIIELSKAQNILKQKLFIT